MHPEHKHQHPGHFAGSKQMQDIQDFNQDTPLTQGFPFVPVGTGIVSPQPIQLTNPGEFLYGIQIVPTVASVDLSYVLFSIMINNFSVLINQSCILLNPTKLLGFIYYPTPQPLIGTDAIQVTFNNQSGASIAGIIVSLFYKPQIQSPNHAHKNEHHKEKHHHEKHHHHGEHEHHGRGVLRKRH